MKEDFGEDVPIMLSPRVDAGSDFEDEDQEEC